MTTSSHSLPNFTREGARWNGVRIPFGINGTTLSLLAIVVLAAVLRLANIGAIGQANTYYTAAVESMLQSWHNFFFVAAEPGGSVSIDKPPVGLWLQTISAYFLGVNGFAVVLPQILAGIGSVILAFHLVRRSFGNAAGLIAAFALAVTPVAIAVERNNTPDGTLIFTLLLAAWAFIKATETRKLRFLLLGAALVGIGFNIKMMQAFLPLPAFYALYLFGSQGGWWRKILHLGLATLVLLPVAFSWATIVDLTPADQRPYVGSSQNNSAFNLIFGYNGLQRLEGGMGGGAPRNTAQNSQGNNVPAAPQQGGTGQPPTNGSGQIGGPLNARGGFNGGPGGPGGGGGMFGTGQRGVFRLFQSGLAAQVSWLLPFGLIMIVAMAASMSWRRPHTERHRGLILWGGWLITCVVFFSVAGFFHQYYLAMLGAPLAAIVAMGIAFLWQMRAEHPVRAALLLFVAAGVTLAYQVYAVALYQSLGWWLAIPAMLGLAGVVTLLLSMRATTRTLARWSFALIAAALLATPTVWSGLTTAHASQNLPEAYSGNNGRGGGLPGAPGRATQPPTAGGVDAGRGTNQALLTYLEAHTQDTKYLVVVPSSGAGSEYVLQTGRPVLYAGGFSGNDPVIDGDALAKLVANGDVRYVLWGNGGGGRGGNASITSYLQSSCNIVTDASIGTTQNSSPQRSFGPGGGAQTLYQCGS